MISETKSNEKLHLDCKSHTLKPSISVEATTHDSKGQETLLSGEVNACCEPQPHPKSDGTEH